MERDEDEQPSGRPAAAARRGRPVDHAADDQILAVTLDALAESDDAQVTLDGVALRSGRAKTTLYRRWPTKADLLLAAVGAVGRPPEADRLPDRGSLRADLLAVIDSAWLGGPERRLAILGGLAAAARSSPVLADAVRERITAPYVDVYRAILQRAVERGEVPPTPVETIALVAEVIPAMSSHRMSAASGSIGRDFFAAVVDDVVLPALSVPR